MTTDLMVRIGAVGVALALLAAPYRSQIVSSLMVVWGWAKQHRADIARLAIGAALVTVAWFGIPMGYVHPVAALTAVKAAVGVCAVCCAAYLLAGVAMNSGLTLPAWGNAAILLASGGMLIATCPMPRVPAIVSQATAAVYVYEKNDSPIPPALLAEIDRLNRERNIPVTLFEDDTVDGSGEVPDQYKPALAAAQGKVPAFVVLSGTKAIKVVASPKTAEELAIP